MDKGVTCEHLNKLADVLGKELWQSKENLTCFDCGCPGPNLWICLQPDCHHVGCSEVKNDHSTIHHRENPSHCVHMNLSTDRIWCYVCEKEVHVRAALAHARIGLSSPTGSVGGSSGSRFGLDHSVAMNVSIEDDDDMADTDYGDDDSQRGAVGLQNMGNTCYMNAALQALSNTPPLTSYFLDCAPAVALLAADKKPGLSRAYQKLIQEMWSRKTRSYVVPNGILYGIRNVHPMFRGYHQHDAQEFLRCFMDQLHEELKEPVYDIMPEDKLNSQDGDHGDRNTHMRRRAASSGASDAPLFARTRRKSPAPSTYSDTRSDGYFRMHTQSESGETRSVTRHRRSASFAGTRPSSGFYGYTQYSDIRPSGSDSELSCSSEQDETYETCSSGSEAEQPYPDNKECRVGGAGDGSTEGRYRSIVSDVFDGKLLSSVQCLICDRVSTRVETFQDLSLPIPSREHVAMLRAQQLPTHPAHQALGHNNDSSWLWWVLSWLRSWFYGPVVTLQDCLAAFFSADELKGDNMYSCSRCNKLRNGVKMSGVVRLPEVLCIHLKRFRHELMFSSKVGARVAFPINDLNMAPYTHKECTSKVRRYALSAVIVHCGTAGGGHYTAAARGGGGWLLYDDTSVTKLSEASVANAEAYVLFYRKVNNQMTILRNKAAEILETTTSNPNDIKFYVSKQWINKFNTWAEPGPIDNSDFVCSHGGVRPDRVHHVTALAVDTAQPLWDYLHKHFGGGPVCTHLHECVECARAADRLRRRRQRELDTFYTLHSDFQKQQCPAAIYAISMHWFRQWQSFVRDKTPHPPPPVDNRGILVKQEIDGKSVPVLKQGSDHAQLSEDLWRFFTNIYGGGPEVKLKAVTPPIQPNITYEPPHTYENRPLHKKYSESDKEDFCTKSISETNIRESMQMETLQKNQSLQNINNRFYKKASEENVTYMNGDQFETNGNYPDSDENMEPTKVTENGIESSENDANDNPIANTELPNLESISLKSKSKPGKVRRGRRRTMK